MRSFLLPLATTSLLLIPACKFRSSTPETEVAPVTAVPIPDPPAESAADNTIAQAEPAAVSQPAAPEFTLDPAPEPPGGSSASSAEESAAAASSSEDVFNSVVRVLQGALEGTNEETGEPSEGSVYGSIGRALSKGFQEAAAGEDAADE